MDIIKKSVVLTSALTPYIASADTPDRTQLPIPDVRPQTYSQLDVRDVQRPDPTSRVKAPDGAPNVLVILLDDVGFSQSSLFGGAVDMPTLSALAKQGLMYNQFHTTGVSSATRTAILTGRNHHQNNMGSIAETATAFPGNSGSPVYRIDNGEIIGILNKVLLKSGKESALSDPSGISYAIPVVYIKQLLSKHYSI